MKGWLLPGDGQFYKADLHLRTTVSDGRLTPEETKEKYRARAFRVKDHPGLF